MNKFQIATMLAFIVAFSLAYLASDQVKMIVLPFALRIVLASVSIIALLVLYAPMISSFVGKMRRR